MLHSLNLVLLFVICSQCTCKKGEENGTVVQNHIKALRKELFKDRGYDIMARPILNYTHPTDVNVVLDLTYITGLDLQTGVLSSEGWLRLEWKDEGLRWRADEFGGISDIRVTVDKVFRPDVTLLNSIQPENILRTNSHSDLILWKDGHILWWPALSMRTVCEDVNLSDWPYDRHNCTFRFASWTYEGSGLNLMNDLERIGLSNFIDSPEWSVISTYGERIVYTFDGSFVPEVVFSLTIKRKSSSTSYQATVHLPVLCALAFNLMTLFLSLESRLRLYLGSLSFVTLLVVLLRLGNQLGFGSFGTPKVIIYVSQMILLVALTLFWSAFAFNFSTNWKFCSLPPTVVTVIESLQKWLFLGSTKINLEDSSDKRNLTTNGSLKEGVSENNDDILKTTMASRIPEKLLDIVTPNQLLVQVVDRLFFVLQLLLMLVLHN